MSREKLEDSHYMILVLWCGDKCSLPTWKNTTLVEVYGIIYEKGFHYISEFSMARSEHCFYRARLSVILLLIYFYVVVPHWL